MISVTYDKETHQLTVKGHANSAPKGEDLVCAGCSVLYHTLAVNVMSWEESGRLKSMRVQDDEGDALVSWEPLNEDIGCVLDLIAEGVIRGFMLMAQDYPEYVTFRMIGGTDAVGVG